MPENQRSKETRDCVSKTRVVTVEEARFTAYICYKKKVNFID
jgi:hypothetical protein